jgi:hypothetical protein
MLRKNARGRNRGRKVLHVITNLTYLCAIGAAIALGNGLHLREATISMYGVPVAPSSADARREAVAAVMREWEGQRIENVFRRLGLVVPAGDARKRKRTVLFGSLRMTVVDGRLAAVE